MHDSLSAELLSIGQFARSVELSVSAVRFYADRGLLVPAVVDPATGYRSFTTDQIATGVRIRNLRLLGLPLAKVRDALDLPEADARQIIDEHIETLEAALQQARRTAQHLSQPEQSPTQSPPTQSLPKEPRTMTTTELIEGLEQVLPFASTNAEHPHLMSVLVEAKGSSVRLVTTDTHRLAVRDLVMAAPGNDFKALVSAATVRRQLPELQHMTQVTLRADAKSLVVGDDQRSVSMRCVPAEFPNYEPFLAAAESSTSVIVDRQVMIDAFAQFGDAPEPVRVTTAEGTLRLERDQSVADVKCETSGGPVSVAVDPALALECVASTLTDDVVIEIDADPLKTVAFRSATNGTYVSLLMPVKV